MARPAMRRATLPQIGFSKLFPAIGEGPLPSRLPNLHSRKVSCEHSERNFARQVSMRLRLLRQSGGIHAHAGAHGARDADLPQVDALRVLWLRFVQRIDQ